jgi:hypothetical protein
MPGCRDASGNPLVVSNCGQALPEQPAGWPAAPPRRPATRARPGQAAPPEPPGAVPLDGRGPCI